MNDKKIKALLDFDGLAEAERVTGQSYKENDGVSFLGMIFAMEKGQKMEQAMKATNDAYYHIDFSEYLSILYDIGFESLIPLQPHADPLRAKDGDEEAVFVHKNYGIILVLDTFNKNLNSCNFFYCWKPNGKAEMFLDCLSSGGYTKINNEYFWMGHHDGREAIRYHIKQLLKQGQFITPWVKFDTSFLIYMDRRKYNFGERNDWEQYSSKIVIEKFPEDIKKMIKFEEYLEQMRKKNG